MKVMNKGKSPIQILKRQLADISKFSSSELDTITTLKPGFALDLEKETAEKLIKMYPREVVLIEELFKGPVAKVENKKVESLEAEVAKLKAQLAKKEEVPQVDEELEALKVEAKELGLEFHPKIKAKKLKAKIAEAKEKPETTEEVETKEEEK